MFTMVDGEDLHLYSVSMIRIIGVTMLFSIHHTDACSEGLHCSFCTAADQRMLVQKYRCFRAGDDKSCSE